MRTLHTIVVCTIIKNTSQSIFSLILRFRHFSHLLLGFVADSDAMAAVFCEDWLHGKGIKSFWKYLHCNKLVFLLDKSAPEKATWEECATNTSKIDLCHNIFGYVVCTYAASYYTHTLSSMQISQKRLFVLSCVSRIFERREKKTMQFYEGCKGVSVKRWRCEQLVQCALFAWRKGEKNMTNIPFKMRKYIFRCSSGDIALALTLTRMLSPDDGKFLFKHLWKSFRKHFTWKGVKDDTK